MLPNKLNVLQNFDEAHYNTETTLGNRIQVKYVIDFKGDWYAVHLGDTK